MAVDAPQNDEGTIELLRDGREAYPAWLRAIDEARHEILLEMYWFASDRIGWRFADALAQRARDGLEVYLLFDAVGSFSADRLIFDDLRRHGVVVLEYNPIAPWKQSFRLTRVFKRDHRKILVVDGAVAFAGGINIHEEAAPREEGGGNWRDDCARITGPPVAELRRLFFDVWTKRGGPTPKRLGAVQARARREIVRAMSVEDGSLREAEHPAYERRLVAFGRNVARRTRELDVRTRARRAELIRSSPIQVLGHPVARARRNIRRLYLFHIRTAARVILIQNAYFLPDGAVRRSLGRAAKRGVEVRILLPRHSDVPAVGFAAQASFTGLLRAGVHIHEWIDGMMHAKTALVDDWATVGSFNLDHRSLRYNLELNVASTTPSFTRAVETSIRADLAVCEQIDPAAWAKRGRWRRFVSWVYYLFRAWL